MTPTSAQTAHGSQPVTADQVAPGATGNKSGGPITAIRNFFKSIFSSPPRQTQGERQKSNTTPPQTTETTTAKTTSTTVVTNNPSPSS